MIRTRLLAFTMLLCILFALVCPTALAQETPPELISETAVLIDAQTGQVLYDKNMHKQMYPASITKIITVALALENAELNETITMSEEAVFSVGRATSHIALTTDEQITVENAVYAAMLMSANDACNGIAEHVSGSIPEFAKLMTQKAAEWGAKNTNFNNANGLKDDLHVTSAYDMAMIMRHALTIDAFRTVAGAKTYQMPPNNKQDETRNFANQHSMLTDPNFAYDGVIAGKAGYTTAAQYTLVTAAERNGTTLIAVVMKSPRVNDKYYDTMALLDYGFDNFSRHTLSPDALEHTVATVPGADGTSEDYEVSLPESISYLLHKNVSPTDVTQEIVFADGSSNAEEIMLSLSVSDNQYMPSDICQVELVSQAVAVAAEQPAQRKTSITALVFKIIGIVILVPIIGFVLLVIVIAIRKKVHRWRKRRRRRNQRRRY